MSSIWTTILISVALVSNGRAICDIECTRKDDDRSFSMASNSLTRLQNCSWDLETDTFKDHILYVHIRKFDFGRGDSCNASLTLGNDGIFCHLRQQCILYMRNRTTIDFNVVEKYLGFKEPPCHSWEIEQGDVKVVKFRTNSVSIPNFRFGMSYTYIPSDEGVDKEQEIVRMDFDSPDIDEPHSRCDPTECDREGFIVGFAITFTLLVVAIIMLLLCVFRCQQCSARSHPRTRGSFYQTESIDDDLEQKKDTITPQPRSVRRSGHLMRFSKMKRKNTGSNGNFIHFTISRDDQEAAAKQIRSKSLPEIESTAQNGQSVPTNT